MALEIASIENLKQVGSIISQTISSPLLLIYQEDGNFKTHQMGTGRLAPGIIEGLLQYLETSKTADGTPEQSTPTAPTITEQETDSDDELPNDDNEYAEIAEKLESFDLEGENKPQTVPISELVAQIIQNPLDFENEEDHLADSDNMDAGLADMDSAHNSDNLSITYKMSSLNLDGDSSQVDQPTKAEPKTAISGMATGGESSVEMAQPNLEHAEHSEPSCLVSGPFLDLNGLVFNTKHKLIICKSCRVGLPLCGVVNHLSKNSLRTWDNETKAWQLFKVTHPVLRGVKSTIAKNKFLGTLAKDLIDIGAISNLSEILNAPNATAWKEQPICTDGIPVEGIRIDLGHICSVCKYAIRTYDRIRCHAHIDGPKKDISANSRDIIRDVELQTFSEIWPHFFVVYSSHPCPIITPTSPENTSVLGHLEQEQKRILQTYTSTNTGPTRDTLPPIFRDGGIEPWLAQFERSNISLLLPRVPLATDNKKPALFMPLRAAIFSLFCEDLQLIQNGNINSLILHILTNGKSDKRRRSFSVITQAGTISRYATAELRLVWTLLEYEKDAKKNKKKSSATTKKLSDGELFTLDETLEMLLQHLRKALKANTNIREALRSVLDNLYFPSQEQRDRGYTQPIHIFPILQYLAFIFITNEGNYLPIHRIPPLLAQQQYCIRLRGLHAINRNIVEANSKAWQKIAEEFAENFLADFSDAPFSILRFWMHGMSVLAKHTPRPNLVWWRGDKILMFGQEISFTEYKQKTYRKVLHLENFILNEVMFGMYTIEEAEQIFGIQNVEETGDETTLGHGVIANTAHSLMRTYESDLFFQRVFEEKKLGIFTRAGGGFDVNQWAGVAWLNAIHSAFRMLVAACHVLCIAGRGTEWVTISPTNNADGAKGVVYDPEAQTGAFNAAYHKGLSIQGVLKYNRRYIPYEIFRLLYLLLRVVRPLELTVLFLTAIPESHKPATLKAYHNHVFAAMGRTFKSDDITQCLREWFADITEVPMGLHHYRHLAIAVQRKYMKFRNPAPSAVEEKTNTLRGHQKTVGDAHYARPTFLGSCSIEDRDLALEAGREYHKVMGFTTGFSEALSPQAIKEREVFSYEQLDIPMNPIQRMMTLDDDTTGQFLPLQDAKKGKSRNEVDTLMRAREGPAPVLRRSTRKKKDNPKYVDSAELSEE
ncbi:hypothetical protein HYPSUDRAFT_201379 [Hypholoma sublateritium FD-334 SS-4]|uniref:Uncharacterized protein n=1 Tax=Hypholoma sublateritium (strain FD-334 SS-4) TaxID=945553 RepID=A0A0D2PUT1_HYPSF|nr:hypothetical protein HYPSUDRAFT_201379 [Hypholoma sublateritium FD-334 SS-4]